MKKLINKIYCKLLRIYFSHGYSLRYLFLKHKEKKYSFKDYLSIVCIAKNESKYIKEWIDFHLLIGVDKIYLYDNGSDDNLRAAVNSYINDGKLKYTYFPGKARQLDAYNDAIENYKYCTKYMAFIDCDEFLLPEKKDSLKLIIDEIIMKNKRAAGIGVNWRMYGSSGLICMPKGIVIESYLYRGNAAAPGNECIKTIANPRFIKKYEHVHYPTYFLGFNNVNEDGKLLLNYENYIKETKLIRINHYFTKSKEEWIIRRKNGKADTLNENDKRTIEEFYKHDNNDIYDDIMLKYSKLMK